MTAQAEPLIFTIPQQEPSDIKIRLHEIDDDDDGSGSGDHGTGAGADGEEEKQEKSNSEDDNNNNNKEGGITHDVGYVMWPSSILLSRWLAENPDTVLNSKRIVELGAGCGLVGLTVAAMLHQQHQRQQLQQQQDHNCEGHTDSSETTSSMSSSSSVVLTDYLPKVILNLRKNLELNGLSEFGSAAGLDFFDQPGNGGDDYGSNGMFGGGYFGLHHNTEEEEEEEKVVDESPAKKDDDKPRNGWFDMTGRRHPQVDLVLAADILCYSNDATMVANTLQSSLVEGGQAVLVSGDESIRFGAASFPDACRQAGLNMCLIQRFPHPTSASGTNDTDVDPQNLQADLIMFRVEKPVTN